MIEFHPKDPNNKFYSKGLPMVKTRKKQFPLKMVSQNHLPLNYNPEGEFGNNDKINNKPKVPYWGKINNS